MKNALIAALVGLLAAFIAVKFTLPGTSGSSTAKESVYERVMRTGVIRCGYWVSPPLIIRDVNTGKMSGAYVEYIEALADALGLKIEWAGEINLSTYLQDLNQGRFDAECATGWPNALRGKQVEYTNPIGYLPVYLYTKAGNTRFDGHIERINSTTVRFSGHDGGTTSMIHQKLFPQSQLVSVMGDAAYTEPLNMVKYNKADVTAMTAFEGDAFIAQNPGSIKQIKSAPLRVVPISISVAAHEQRFVNMLNTATNELLYDGTVNTLLDKYNIQPTTILRVAPPYQE